MKFPTRLANLVGRYHAGMDADTYASRLFEALDTLDSVMDILEQRVGKKGEGSKEERIKRLRAHTSREMRKGQAARKRREAAAAKQHRNYTHGADGKYGVEMRDNPRHITSAVKRKMRDAFALEDALTKEQLNQRRIERDGEKAERHLLQKERE